MPLVQTANSALSRLFPFPKTRSKTQPSAPPIKPFPQFSLLPTELRLKIWSYAAPSRLVRIHIHQKDPALLIGEDRWEGYAPNWIPPVGTAPSRYSNYPRFVPGPMQRLPTLPNYHAPPKHPHHMVITLCSDKQSCGCSSFPPKSKNSLPAPGVTLACHESRDMLLSFYKRYLEHEYDAWGNQVLHPITLFQKPLPRTASEYEKVQYQKARAQSKISRTGITFNSLIDAIHLSVNVASASSVMELNRFAGVLARQIPDVQRVVLSLHIFMPPYKFMALDRLQFWQNWGGSGWWVPVNRLCDMKSLRELVMVVKKSEKMLPNAWKMRTQEQWGEELMAVWDRWPREWEGRMPVLRFVESVDEI